MKDEKVEKLRVYIDMNNDIFVRLARLDDFDLAIEFVIALLDFVTDLLHSGAIPSITLDQNWIKNV